ncbi:kinesin-like protein KIN-4A [Tanacetum coccineum]
MIDTSPTSSISFQRGPVQNYQKNLQNPISAQIRRIFLDGYGVLDVRTVIFKCLRLSSKMRAFLLIFTKYSIITAILKYKRLGVYVVVFSFLCLFGVGGYVSVSYDLVEKTDEDTYNPLTQFGSSRVPQTCKRKLGYDEQQRGRLRFCGVRAFGMGWIQRNTATFCVVLLQVRLLQKVKQEADRFLQKKAIHNKQLMQVKKGSSNNEYELNNLNALYQRQTQVIQMKTEETGGSTEKLKKLLESWKIHCCICTCTERKGNLHARKGPFCIALEEEAWKMNSLGITPKIGLQISKFNFSQTGTLKQAANASIKTQPEKLIAKWHRYNMEEAGPKVTEKPINGSVHLDLDLENDDDDMMIDAPSVRDLDQPPEVSHRRQVFS